MPLEREESRRRLVHPGYLTENVSWDWDSKSFIRAKAIRVIALSGLNDLNIHGVELKKPLGVVEIIGSRVAKFTTAMLAVFSAEIDEIKSAFCLTEDSAVGVMYFPAAMFSGVIQLTSAPAVYIRMGDDGASNSISNDGNFTSAPLKK